MSEDQTTTMGIRATKQTSPTPSIKRDPKKWKRVKDKAGFWKWVQRKTGEGMKPPSVRARDEKRAGQVPAQKYGSPKRKRAKPLNKNRRGNGPS